ncbi:hypothetical protein FIV42_22225 [Persicimonas caeni]|uniref:Uncharacterized protein n=1 Tax=Persicimonas caeni TaxID=2292766 RepID=A0A4Y6PYN3_PERCE|nr:hypothetical protein [Persicimonas caeni]QDG53363.1 hypothetical protein FIV42_22225 [Persicimonas caeni]QED34584.1 hypothetical protein FRD00_22220 [Persicimonas caeni]
MYARTCLVALTLVAISGCNTFFESSPEFIENSDVGLDTQVEDVTEDVAAADAEDVDDVDTTDVDDVADAVDADANEDGGDAVEGDAGDTPAREWSVTDLASRDVLPKVSLTGSSTAGGGPAEFGVAYIEADGVGSEQGIAFLERIALPQTTKSGSERVSSQSDEQWDVATGVDEGGALVWGAVQSCQNAIVAHVVTSSSQQVPIDGGGCATTETLTQTAITGGLHKFAGVGGPEPNWVWTGEASNTEDLISAINESFAPNTTDQTIVRSSEFRIDPDFIRASGGRLVLMRSADRKNVVVWDAVARSQNALAPVLLDDINLTNGGDLIWLENHDYLLVTFTDERLNLSTLTCDLSSSSPCGDSTVLDFVDEQTTEAFGVAAFSSGFVLGALVSNQQGHSLVFRVYTVTATVDSYLLESSDSYSVQLSDVSPVDFDVAAAFTDGELFVAAAVLREPAGSRSVEVHGYRFPDFWSTDY